MKALLFVFVIFVSFTAVRAQDALSPAQIDRLREIKAATEKKAAPAALGFAETAKRIYANMLAEREDQKLRKRLGRDLHRFAGQLLDIKGQSFRDTLSVLTPSQKHRLAEEMQKPDAPGDLGEAVEKTFAVKLN